MKNHKIPILVLLLFFIIALPIISFNIATKGANQNLGNISITPKDNQSSSMQMKYYVPNTTETVISPTIPLANCPVPKSTSGVSPYIFGTNIGDQLINSQKTKDLFKQIHVQFLRVGFLSGTDTTKLAPKEIKILETVRDMCITPLFILDLRHYGKDPTDMNITIVKTVYEIFKNRPVYFEMGNEPDLPGVPADKNVYTAQWNHVIHVVKPLDPYAKFGGPVLARMDPDYMSFFYHQANPKPDFLSWHEYNCIYYETASQCSSHLSIWKTHMDMVKNALKQNADTAPPLIISEWNFGANPRASSAYMQQFAETAFAELAKDGYFASNQFKSTDFSGEYLLINPNDTLTGEGIGFQNMYQKYFGK